MSDLVSGWERATRAVATGGLSEVEEVTGEKAQRRADRKARRELQAQQEQMEQEQQQERRQQRRRRESMLRSALRPQRSLFGMLGGAQRGRDTLG